MWTIEVRRRNRWCDLGEGPWHTREDAEAFGRAEVGVEWRLVPVLSKAGNDGLNLPERIEQVVRGWGGWSRAEVAHMDEIVAEVIDHCANGTGNAFIRSWVNRILVPAIPGMVER